MQIKSIKPLIFITILSLAFAIGFYIDGQNATVNNLSSDQWNILPVCIKLDHPELYEGDLFVADANDVDYYIPLFIAGIRFFTRWSHDNYIEGLNKFNFFINFFYTFFWGYFFYYLSKNIPLSLLMTILVRGILWLPGYELWGAGALWTALPRTAFLALLPLPLMLLLPVTLNKYYHFAGALFIGIISNYHPISGLGLCFSVWLTYFIYHRYLINDKPTNLLVNLLIIAFLMILGLSPYIIRYLQEVLTQNYHNKQMFTELIHLRIGDQFYNPYLALTKFGQVKWIIFLAVPIISIILLRKRLPEDLGKIASFSFVLLAVILGFSFLVVPVEQLIQKTGIKLHMAFQLIRNVKFVMIPVFVFYFIILVFAISKIKPHYKKIISLSLLFCLLILLLFSRVEPVRSLPLMGDDLIRSTLPNIYSLRKENGYEDPDLEKMFEWINSNTEKNVKFVGPPQIRISCRRSVIFDFKGAAMLIEGNPDKYVQWGNRLLELRKCTDIQCKIALYKKWGADYLLSDEVIVNKHTTFSSGRWNLYQL